MTNLVDENGRLNDEITSLTAQVADLQSQNADLKTQLEAAHSASALFGDNFRFSALDLALRVSSPADSSAQIVAKAKDFLQFLKKDA